MKDPNARNASESASNKGGRLTQHPPAAGSHAPKSVHRINGGYGAGGDTRHPSLRK